MRGHRLQRFIKEFDLMKTLHDEAGITILILNLNVNSFVQRISERKEEKLYLDEDLKPFNTHYFISMGVASARML